MSDKKSFLELKQEELRHALECDRIAHEISFYEDRKHDTATLTERLTQAERELAELRQYSAMRDKDLRAAREHAEKRSEEATRAERERDEWKVEAERLKSAAMNWREEYTMTVDRDREQMRAERNAALAKAEAAEKRADAWERTAMDNDSTWQIESNEHAALRARIEALANAPGHIVLHHELYALLRPPKPETAYEITSRATKAPDCDAWVLSHKDFCRLRDLLKGD